MPRMVCVASLSILLLVPALAAGQSESAASSGVGPTTALPQIVVPADAAPVARPAPKMYHFDLSPRAFKPQPISTTPSWRAADFQVRPAAALIGSVREIVLEDESSALKREPPKSPSDERPPMAGGVEVVPPPEAYLPSPPPFDMGWLGGIPTFTHDYCPLYWDDPWRNYCCERCRGQCQRSCSPAGGAAGPCDCGEAAMPGCDACSGAADVGKTWEPTPLPPIESSPSDRPPTVPTESTGTPAKRRLPRNEIPQQTKSDNESGG